MCLTNHCNEANNCCIVSKFNNSVGRVSWSTVIGVKGVKQTQPRGAPVLSLMVEESDHLRAVGKEVSNPGADGGGEAQVGQLVCEDVRDDRIKQRASSYRCFGAPDDSAQCALL